MTSISAMPTPNPNTIKFMPETPFFDSGSLDFPNAEAAKGSPLAETLFEIEEVEGVMVGFNFISVTKKSDTSWEDSLEEIRDAIIEFLETGTDPLSESQKEELASKATLNSELDLGIQKILDEEIRPAIAMDGGDVEYLGINEEGIVTLRLQGACSSCPASTMTLKMGIENRLKEEFPEIKEVVQEGIELG